MEDYRNLIIMILFLTSIFFYLNCRIYKNALNTRNITYKTLWDDYMNVLTRTLQMRQSNEVLNNKLINMQRKIDSKKKRL